MSKKRAIISVHDKTGVAAFAKELCELGFEIVSTGGTARHLSESGIDVTEVSDVTGFPEVLDGRVKTLHPLIHAGILARRIPSHEAQLEQIGASWVDMVVINLYPFQQTVDAGKDHETVIENIDIGGPSMIRAACKNYERVAVVTSPDRYEGIVEELKKFGNITDETRFELAREAFHHTAAYDCAIANYFDSESKKCDRDEDITNFVMGAQLCQTLRYGENPHQKAAFYRTTGVQSTGLASMRQLSGKELSFNNLMDMNSALAVVNEFGSSKTVVSIIKHNTPCGVAVGDSVADAYSKALECDSVSAFGGIVACNREIDAPAAELMKKLFLEVIVAPSFSEQAKEILMAKSKLRLVEVSMEEFARGLKYDIKAVSGGYLVQEADVELTDTEEGIKVVTDRKPTNEEMDQLMSAWRVVKQVKSNAIVLWKDDRTVGIGAGQMNRVGAANIAVESAGENSRGSVMASDAYFPFGDTIEQAHSAGVTAVIQPGGSIRDNESIEACNKYGIAMVFTGMRHFRH